MAKGGKHNQNATLETTSLDPHFALAADGDFAALTDPLGSLPGGPYDYAFVSTEASAAGNITIGASLAALNGIIATGNGKDNIDLSNSTGANLVLAGNGVDTVVGGAGSDNISGENGKDTITGGADTGVFTQIVDVTDPNNPITTTTFTAGDVLSGGEAKDTFHYTFGDGVDEITDFRLGQDKLVLHGIDEADLVTFVSDGDLYVGVSDGLGGMAANSMIRVDNVTDVDAFLDKGLLLA